jgi:ABC-2 type transport system permease protein
MSALLRAELLKLHTVRASWWYALACVAFVPVSIAVAVAHAGSAGYAPLDSTSGVRAVFAAASAGGTMLLVVGILLTSGEFHHRTAAATFLVTPDRRRVLAAKLGAASLVGAAAGALCSLLTLAIAIPVLQHRGVDVAPHALSVTGVLAGCVVGTAISGLLGVGLGALLRSQTVAIVVALAWLFLVEGLLIAFAPAVGRWLPGGAASALAGTDTGAGELLPAWAAALVLIAYGCVLATIGSRLVLRRDVA